MHLTDNFSLLANISTNIFRIEGSYFTEDLSLKKQNEKPHIYFLHHLFFIMFQIKVLTFDIINFRLPVVSDCPAGQTARVTSNLHSSSSSTMAVSRVPSPPLPEVNTPVAENWCYTQVSTVHFKILLYSSLKRLIIFMDGMKWGWSNIRSHPFILDDSPFSRNELKNVRRYSSPLWLRTKYRLHKNQTFYIIILLQFESHNSK